MKFFELFVALAFSLFNRRSSSEAAEEDDNYSAVSRDCGNDNPASRPRSILIRCLPREKSERRFISKETEIELWPASDSLHRQRDRVRVC